MSFSSSIFLILLPAFVGGYYATPRQWRYLVLLGINWLFYGWNSLSMLLILLIVTLISYSGGYILEKKRSRVAYAVCILMTLSVLFFYKYAEWIARQIGFLFFSRQKVAEWNIVVPVGISFYVFQASGYLGDIYRERIEAEKNLLRYAVFVSFFPTILSGPIQKARELLPQLSEPGNFSKETAVYGFVLMVWGFFEKFIVSSKLAGAVSIVFDHYADYDGIYYLIAAVCFSLYIYSDFSAYSDIACGIANIFGFKIRKNFRNPYLAESLADFWNRWHMSLNSWFVENIYIPLGGNRKGKARKYLNIMAVFLLSGAWHGASWNFILWGGLNGFLRILGEILIPIKDKMYECFKIDKSAVSIRLLKKSGVFIFITITWIFFRIPSVKTACYFIKNMLLFQPITIFNSGLVTYCGTALKTFELLLVVGVFGMVQYSRREEGKYYCVFRQQPLFIQYIALAFIICCCIFAACSGTSAVNTQFIYFQF